MLDEEEHLPLDKHVIEPVRLKLSDVATAKEDAAPEFLAECEKYFSHFVKPCKKDAHGDGHDCFHCGEPLTGLFAAILSRGGFTWGLAHGEGFCANCKWPARAHHFAKAEDGSDLFTLRNFVLQYHPDFVGKREEAA